MPGLPDLDGLQGPLFLTGMISAFVYLLRLAGVFGHPLEHIVGILCWAVLLGCAWLRFVWEQRQGGYPMRWGGVVVRAFALGFGLGIIVELAIATNPTHRENQAANVV